MHKIELEKNSPNKKTYQLDFHDVVIMKQSFNYLSKQFKSWLNYIIIINLFFVYKAVVGFYKQIVDTIWIYYFKNYFKWWSLIYLLPLIILGIVLPACLTPVFQNLAVYTVAHKTYLHAYIVYLWGSWIGVSAFFVVFASPYSMLVLLKVMTNNLNKIYAEQVKRSRFDH